MSVQIQDNFLNQRYFDSLHKKIMGQSFSWFYTDYIVEKDKRDSKFQFIHTIYDKTLNDPDTYEKLKPMFQLMGAKSVWRIKLNLIPKTYEIEENEYHTDIHENSNEGWYTSIFYMNTNDGYTIFDNGTMINSVKNRLITFPAKMRHAGTSCTDQKRRVVINFNYRKKL